MPVHPPLLTEVGLRGLGILAKEPCPGQVKTRLTPPLSPEQAAALYGACLDETIARLGQGDFAAQLFYRGTAGYFAERYPHLPRRPQSPGDLGARLTAAATQLFSSGCRAVALVGSDSPDLPLPMIDAAFAALAECDAVAIPAADGGYVLIALRRPAPQLFRQIPWSSPAVLAATRAQAASHGIRWQELGSWEDLDDLAALRRLLQRSPDSATARHARLHLADHL